MANSFRFISILCIVLVFSHESLANPSMCPKSSIDFSVDGLNSTCPAWIEKIPPEEVSGDVLDNNTGDAQKNMYFSIFFYASWCPFSRKTRPIFDALSSMFPQIRHMAIEESSAMPSLFSRYGIHSFPSILMTSRTTRMHYHGPKELDSLVKFYKETTGFHPVAYFSVEETPITPNRTPLNFYSQSVKEIVKSEPCLSFAVLFVCLKALIFIVPIIVSHIKAFLFAYALHVNSEIFGEWSHLLERALHVIDLRKIWSKLSLFNKGRNFRKGATNAGVWASSLTSVSLGESSSTSRN